MRFDCNFSKNDETDYIVFPRDQTDDFDISFDEISLVDNELDISSSSLENSQETENGNFKAKFFSSSEKVKDNCSKILKDLDTKKT